MARKNKRKRINRTKELSIFGRLVQRKKAVVYCELHKCYLEPKDIAEKKCNFKRCKHMSKFQRFKRITRTFGDLSKREIKEMIKNNKSSEIDWYNEL